jgi:hypothetical protein
VLRDAHVPVYPFPEDAIRALGRAAWPDGATIVDIRARVHPVPPPPSPSVAG